MNYKLAVTNFFISHILILIFLVFAYFNWFPHSLSDLNGFGKQAQLIILVNLVLGPLLFLIICKKNKKIIKKDLSFLVILQSTAMFFGAYSIYQKHPNYAVFTIDRFTLIETVNSEPQKIRFKELETSFFSKTKLAFAKLPDNIDKRNELILSSMINPQNDLDKRHEYFEPYNKHIHSIATKSMNTKKLFSTDQAKSKLSVFLYKYGGSKEDYLYLPLQSTSKDVVWVLDRKTAQPVGIIDIDPWS